MWRLACQLLHLTVQVDAADAYVVCQVFVADVRIVQIIVDECHDALHEFLVR